MIVEVYTKEACPQCRATLRRFERLGTPVVELDAMAHREFLAGLGIRTAPGVVCRDKGEPVAWWGGFVPDNVDAAAWIVADELAERVA